MAVTRLFSDFIWDRPTIFSVAFGAETWQIGGLNLAWKYAGKQPYESMWARQEAHRREILSGISEGCLFLVQHPPTISLGRAEKGGNLLVDRNALVQSGFDVVETNRGGKVTYHGPGQLVAYPVVDMRKFGMGVKTFVCALEKTMIDCLARLAITAHRKDGYPGVWVGARKIGSIGIHVRKQVSIHGLALNIHPNIEHFNVITSCGIEGVQVTSVEQEGVDISVEQILEPFIESFSRIFGCQMQKLREPTIRRDTRLGRPSALLTHV